MRSALAATIFAFLVLMPATSSAARPLPYGLYTGQTSDGYAVEFQVVFRDRDTASYPVKITNFLVRFPRGDCRRLTSVDSLTSVYFGRSAKRRGRFAADVGISQPDARVYAGEQLSLTGRFSSASAASGQLQTGHTSGCPISKATPVVTFKVKRTTAAQRLQQLKAMDSKAIASAKTAVAFVESCGAAQSSFATCSTLAVRNGTGLDDVEMSGMSATSYTLTARSESGSTFIHARMVDGTVVRSCTSAVAGGPCDTAGKDGSAW